MGKFVLTGEPLSLKELYDISFNNVELEISPEAQERVKEARSIFI